MVCPGPSGESLRREIGENTRDESKRDAMTAPPAQPRAPRKDHARELFAPLPRHYDRVAALLSFGQDPRWRRTMVAAVNAEPGARVLDVATGTGLVARELVRRYGCTVVGLDQSPEMLAGARAPGAR